MKAQKGQKWKVSIKPGGTEYPRTVEVMELTDTHALVENVETRRKGKIRLDANGGIAGYEYVEG